MRNLSDDILEQERYELLGSFLDFTQRFYYLRTGRTFDLSNPPGRESHILTIMRELVLIHRGNNNLQHLLVNVPPRYGKTEIVIHFQAWALAHNPACNFIYTSYSYELAAKQTGTVKEILEMRQFKNLFEARIKRDSRAKDNFETIQGGSVYAAGTGGTITGRGAGIMNSEIFSGAVIIDDSIKPDEATSETIRARINNWSNNTLSSRLNNPSRTPIIFIGQRVHEADLADKYKQEKTFKEIAIPALDIYNNPLDPKRHTREMLLEMKAKMPYEFASQYQQTPVPAGGALFKEEWFVKHDIDPITLKTFITVDTAETEKNYNDASVFSFWGIYEIEQRGKLTGDYGLHWINCREDWIEAANLEDEFFDFFGQCSIHPVKPRTIIIEKKSTGVTLSGVLKKMQGLRCIPIERTKASKSKADRYIEMQPFISQRFISLPTNGNHTAECIAHMTSITANDTHRRDDICDTVYDAIRSVFIDKTLLINIGKAHTGGSRTARLTTSRDKRVTAARQKAYYDMGETR